MKKWRKKKNTLQPSRIDCVRKLLKKIDIVEYEKCIGARENLNLNLFVLE